MKILFNASTLRKGGPLQRAVTFLLEMRKDPLQHRWHVAASDAVLSQLQRCGAEPIDDLHVFSATPARSREGRRRLVRLERSLQPDCVYTFAAPAYVKFDSPHLLGCSSAWLTHWSWRACRATASPYEIAKNLLSQAYKGRWLQYADAWVVQTPTAQRGLQRRLGVPLGQIAVVPNTCGSVYVSQPPRPDRRPNGGRRWRFLSFAAPYPHKRLDLIPHVAREMATSDPSLSFEFVLTLPPQCHLFRSIMRKARALGVQGAIANEGPVPVADGPKLYASCDVCFLPTILETFSATYPESMAMNVPIVTTDLPFARDACGDAALYFKPSDPRSAADQLLQVVHDRVLFQRLVEKGSRVLAELPSPQQQYRRYVQLLANLVG